MAWAVKLKKNVPFLGREALTRLAAKKLPKLLACFTVDDPSIVLLGRETISIGSLNTTRTHPREILQPAIACSALGFILGHNHPSGSLTPSQDDIDFTRAIKRASEIVGIGLYDHIIVASGGFVSLKEKGLL